MKFMSLREAYSPTAIYARAIVAAQAKFDRAIADLAREIQAAQDQSLNPLRKT